MIMHKPGSLVEALEASNAVQSGLEGARGDAEEWRTWEADLYDKAHTLSVPVADWEKFLALCDILCETDTATDGREKVTVVDIEDGHAVWSTADTHSVYIFAGAAIDLALYEAPRYGYNPPEPSEPGEEPYQGFLVTDEEAEEED
jgi:hypothetical protein